MDMQHKKITVLSSKMLAKLRENGKAWFTTNQIYDLFPELSDKSVMQQLVTMTNAGILMRIREGLYYVVPYEAEAEDFMPDWHLLAEPLVRDEHYIGFYSALQIHQLVTQPSLKEQIVVTGRIKPSEKTIRGVRFQFVFYNETHFFGHERIWIDNFNRVFCSDLEKTIIDCLYKPNYAGGIVEIAKAIHAAREKINFETLSDYALRFDVQAVVKRLGYLLELLRIETPLIETLLNKRSTSVAPLDTEIPETGKINTRWNVRRNIDEETIKSAILT